MKFDGIVIGGGPAGMFAAITAASHGSKVLLLEANERLGKKLLITGKGRCNVTNNCDKDTFMLNTPHGARFMHSAFSAFSSLDTMDFFEEMGVPLKTERGNRVFPVSDKAVDIVDALVSAIKKFDVKIVNATVASLVAEENRIQSVVLENGQTSGFSSIDFNVWPSLSHLILVLLMFCGGCAGSTSGGIKVSRIMLLAKNGKREIKYISQPKAIMSVKMNGKAVDNEIIRGATSFIIMYGTLFVISALVITAIDGVDPITSFTSVATSINNVGPGLGEAGPAENFGFYSVFSKLILCFNMLAGRLELFPILILLSPTAYRKQA